MTTPKDLELIQNSRDINDIVHVPPELLGQYMALIPKGDTASSPREVMFAKQFKQHIKLIGAEHAYLFTTTESEFAKYTFKEILEDDVIIVATIAKYSPAMMNDGIIRESPLTLVIARRLKDNVIIVREIPTHKLGSDGYGYPNKIVEENVSRLNPGAYIEAGTKLYDSPAVEGSRYKYGINLRTALIPISEDSEDAIVISDEAAEKCSYYEYRTVVLVIKRDQITLNRYGDGDEIKFFPDIGEYINDDGILAGFRTTTPESFISDMSAEASRSAYLHDTLIYGDPEGVVVDVNVDVNLKAYEGIKADASYLSQLDKYIEADKKYYKTIADHYNMLRSEYEIEPESRGYFHNAMGRLCLFNVPPYGKKGKRFIPSVGENEIDLARVTITYKVIRKLKAGCKITGRDGSKGVISEVRPKHMMPKDENGIASDIAVSPDTVPNRMNTPQLYDIGINRISHFVLQKAKSEVQMGNYDAAYHTIMEYIGHLNPVQRNRIHDAQYNVKMFVDETLSYESIFLWIQPTQITVTPEMVKILEDKYGAHATRVRYALPDGDGGVLRWVERTEHPVTIGHKYYMVLYKLPKVTAVAHSFVNQLHVPIHPSKHSKLSVPGGVAYTPCRIGVDEERILKSASEGKAIVRMMSLYSSSVEYSNELCDALLTVDNPHEFEGLSATDQEIVDGDVMKNTVAYTFAGVGVDIRNTACTESGERINNYPNLNDGE
jgi:hypothetical protein